MDQHVSHGVQDRLAAMFGNEPSPMRAWDEQYRSDMRTAKEHGLDLSPATRQGQRLETSYLVGKEKLEEQQNLKEAAEYEKIKGLSGEILKESPVWY